MNKKTKSLIAGVVGAGLLLGAGGTFALWFDTVAIGADGDQVNTGRLALDGTGEGEWTWLQASFGQPWAGQPFNVLRDGDGNIVLDDEDEPTFNNAEIVPGDTLQYAWDNDQIGVILSGDSLFANLYLDGVGYVNPADIAPLTLTISGAGWTIEDISSLADYLPYSNRGTFLLVPQLTAANAGSLLEAFAMGSVDEDGNPYFELPNIVLDFPANFNTGYGFRPGDLVTSQDLALGDGHGYGRGRTDVLAGVFNPANLRVRLQQIVSTDGTEGVPSAPIGSVTPPPVGDDGAPTWLNNLPNGIRSALNEYVVNDGPAVSGFPASLVEQLRVWLSSASATDIAEWLAGGN